MISDFSTKQDNLKFDSQYFQSNNNNHTNNDDDNNNANNHNNRFLICKWILYKHNMWPLPVNNLSQKSSPVSVFSLYYQTDSTNE